MTQLLEDCDFASLVEKVIASSAINLNHCKYKQFGFMAFSI